jgi:transcriptional regulator with XRE-family HTH domain
MALKDKIKELRQRKNWSQGQLAIQLKANQKQISAYERGVNIPSTEMLIRMSQVFDVSLDYLVFEAEGVESNIKVRDRELLQQFEQVDKLNDSDKKIVKELLDLVILKNKFQSLVNHSDSSPA